MDEASKGIHEKLDRLRLRIKNTSSVRFYASRRVRTNYRIAQLTVVILSLWAIFISYILASKLADALLMNTEILTAVGVILPVFIVVFSLLENGEVFLRAHQLEHNARQLRELSDQLYTSAAVKGLDPNALLHVYDTFSQRYSDCLERTPINHDDIDHFQRMIRNELAAVELSWTRYFQLQLQLIPVSWKIHYRRVLYVGFWVLPVIFLTFPKRH